MTPRRLQVCGQDPGTHRGRRGTPRPRKESAGCTCYAQTLRTESEKQACLYAHSVQSSGGCGKLRTCPQGLQNHTEGALGTQVDCSKAASPGRGCLERKLGGSRQASSPRGHHPQLPAGCFGRRRVNAWSACAGQSPWRERSGVITWRPGRPGGALNRGTRLARHIPLLTAARCKGCGPQDTSPHTCSHLSTPVHTRACEQSIINSTEI